MLADMLGFSSCRVRLPDGGASRGWRGMSSRRAVLRAELLSIAQDPLRERGVVWQGKGGDVEWPSSRALEGAIAYGKVQCQRVGCLPRNEDRGKAFA